VLCKDEAFEHFLLISCSFVDAVVSTFSRTRQYFCKETNLYPCREKALPLQGEHTILAGRVGIHRKEKLGRDLISREAAFSLKIYTESKFTLFTVQCIEDI